MLSEQAKNGSINPANEQEITLGILKYVQNDKAMTQRSIAKELGIALGLVNRYLKRCITKGWIKVNHAPANRYMYYLTPVGFAEKSNLTREFLYQSFNFFRVARLQCSDILETCERKGWKRIALIGAGDLADIVILHAKDHAVKILAIVDPLEKRTRSGGVNVVQSVQNLRRVDALILTDLADAQASYARLTEEFEKERILIPDLLDVLRKSTDLETADKDSE